MIVEIGCTDIYRAEEESQETTEEDDDRNRRKHRLLRCWAVLCGREF